MNLSRQDAFYLARVLVGLPVAGVDAHPYLMALVTTGAIADANRVLAVLGADALKAALAEDPHTPPTPASRPRAEVDIPPLPANAQPRAEDLDAAAQVGQWQRQYVAWASKTANESPVMYHEAAALWAANLALARRVYIATPWGERVFSNLYIMLLGETTVHRKSTAYNLVAEQVGFKAIPHMFLPKPGSGEQFTRTLAGKMPDNFGELSQQDKDRLLRGRAFAAQRGLVWDELAGLFGSTKRDFMAGLKQLLLDLYGCPALKEWETGKYGRTIIRDAALSILGATTPADLGLAVGEENWRDGLLARFALVMPEPDFADREPLDVPDDATRDALIAGLRRLHEALPAPEVSEDPTAPLPPGDPPRALVFAAWEEVRAYSKALRDLCRPESGLDERLRGHYGRLHVQALKLALILAVMDWAETAEADAPLPVVRRAHWARAWQIAEGWRASLHRALDTLDVSAEARQEMSDDRRVLFILRQYPDGCSGRELGKFAKIGSKRLESALRRLADGGEVREVPPEERPARAGRSQSWFSAESDSDGVR